MGRRPAGHVPSYISRGRWRRGRPGLRPRAAAVSGAPPWRARGIAVWARRALSAVYYRHTTCHILSDATCAATSTSVKDDSSMGTRKPLMWEVRRRSITSYSGF